MHTQERDEMAGVEGSPINSQTTAGVVGVSDSAESAARKSRSIRKEIKCGQVKVCPSNLSK